MIETCPNCGSPVTFLLDGSYHDAPWLCTVCSRAWWPSELNHRSTCPHGSECWESPRRSFSSECCTEMAEHAEDDKLATHEERIDRRVAIESATIPDTVPEG